jgi:hypothetical protein
MPGGLTGAVGCPLRPRRTVPATLDPKGARLGAPTGEMTVAAGELHQRERNSRAACCCRVARPTEDVS